MRTTLFLIGCLLTLAVAPLRAAPVNADHVTVELIGDNATAVPGKPILVGLHLIHEAHWHTYWINPGDSGLPTNITWHLPNGFVAGDIAWPAPERFAVGDLYNFGYDGDVLLPVKIDVPADAKIGSSVSIAADASWLVCREECVPGKTTLSIDLPVRQNLARNAKYSRLFDAATARQPQPAAWNGQARTQGERVEVDLSGDTLPVAGDLDAFVVQRKVVGNAPPRIVPTDHGLMLLFVKNDYFTSVPPQIDLLLRRSVGDDVHAWAVTLPLQADHP